MTGSESPIIEKGWMGYIDEERLTPDFDKPNVIIVNDGDDDKQEFTGMYIIYKETGTENIANNKRFKKSNKVEEIFLASKKKIDEVWWVGTRHIKAMYLYHHEKGLLNLFKQPKYNYLVGFYYKLGKIEYISSANPYSVGKRDLPDHVQEQIEKIVRSHLEP